MSMSAESHAVTQGNRCTVSVSATGASGPSIVEVATLLIDAGVRVISVTSTAGVIRTTVPVEAVSTAVQVLAEALVPAPGEAPARAHRPKRRFGRVIAPRSFTPAGV
jgi:hypothetical protein